MPAALYNFPPDTTSLWKARILRCLSPCRRLALCWPCLAGPCPCEGQYTRSLIAPHIPAFPRGKPLPIYPRQRHSRSFCCCDYFLHKKNHHNSCPWIIALPWQLFLPFNGSAIEKYRFISHRCFPQGKWMSPEYSEDRIKTQRPGSATTLFQALGSVGESGFPGKTPFFWVNSISGALTFCPAKPCQLQVYPAICKTLPVFHI